MLALSCFMEINKWLSQFILIPILYFIFIFYNCHFFLTNNHYKAKNSYPVVLAESCSPGSDCPQSWTSPVARQPPGPVETGSDFSMSPLYDLWQPWLL